MARCTVSEVKEIFDNCKVLDSVITTMINTASAVIDKVFADDTELGETLRKEVERWYAAHLIASGPQRQEVEETATEARVKYSGTYGDGIYSTSYGQQAVAIDFTGRMAKLGKRRVVFFAVPTKH